MISRQLSFDQHLNLNNPHSPEMTAAIEKLSTSVSSESRGAVFTRSEVVEFILDLVGYTTDQPLHQQRILEPSCGRGDFLLPIVSRLLTAWKTTKKTDQINELKDAIRAVELHRATFQTTRQAVIALLIKEKFTTTIATELVDRWLSQADFLLAPLASKFDFVVGNPPYVRQELIPPALLLEYRCRYQTIYDRADLYIPFIERSLMALTKGGSLAFICADRWMRNRYGGSLRGLVAEQFHLKIYVDMVNTPAFHDEWWFPAVSISISPPDSGAALD